MLTTTPRGLRQRAFQPGGQHLGWPTDPSGRPTILFDPESDGQGGAGGDGGQGGAGGGGDAGLGGQQQQYTPPATQADLDRIVGERLARERAKFPTPEELADLRQKAEAHDALAAASLTAEQQATARAEAAEQAAQQATERANTIARRAALVAAASKAKAVDPDVVADLLANSNAVTIDDAGQVTGAETAVQTLLTEKPYLAGGDAGAGGSNGGGSTGFGGGHGRGGASESAKGSVASGREAYESQHRRKTTTT